MYRNIWKLVDIKKEDRCTRFVQMRSCSSSESLVTGVVLRFVRGGTIFQSSSWKTEQSVDSSWL